MELTRRRLVQIGLLGMAGASVGLTAACGDSASGDGDASSLSLWIWGGGLSTAVLDEAVKKFTKPALKTQEIGGDFKAKLLTTMAGGRGVPDITGVKGEDIAAFYPQAKQFIDLNTLGADKLKSQYLDWKWAQGAAPDGTQIGIPIDIGPTALFYRQDVFAEAGLPTEPADVAAAASTYDDYYALGVELKAKLPDHYLVKDIATIFDMVVKAQSEFFVDKDDTFIGDQDHIRGAWDTSIKALTLGIDAKITDSNDHNAGMTNGTLPAQLGAAWFGLDIANGAPDSAGKWRVTPNPGGPANIGGSFLTIPKSSAAPDEAFEVITWILSPENEARGFADASLFPATPASYSTPELTKPDPFFGDQVTIDVFGPQAEKIPVAFTSPYDAAVQAAYNEELGKVETQGKDPEDAWDDAVDKAKSVAERLGVSV
jgi:cellobiose transport system substrate-binding protein